MAFSNFQKKLLCLNCCLICFSISSNINIWQHEWLFNEFLNRKDLHILFGCMLYARCVCLAFHNQTLANMPDFLSKAAPVGIATQSIIS